MYVFKSRYEEPDSLRQAWLAIAGVRRVKMATVLVGTMIYGEVYVQTGASTLEFAQLLMAAATRTLGNSIKEFSVVIEDEGGAPIDFKWTRRSGWKSTVMRLFHAERQRRRGWARP